MRAELEELKSELKSCREIIRIIQEEAQVIKPTPYAAWNIVNGDRTEDLQANVQDGRWQNSSNRRRRPQNIRRQLQQLPEHTSNRFEPLSNLKDENGVSRCSTMESRCKVSSDLMARKQSGIKNVVKTKNDKQKIVIIGDSHIRNCAAELKQQLGRKCSVSGYVKSGAGLDVIVHSVKEEIGKLNGEDVVVVWGGSK
jgi:hypothetical protein